jgi:hypothetical protein
VFTEEDNMTDDLWKGGWVLGYSEGLAAGSLLLTLTPPPPVNVTRWQPSATPQWVTFLQNGREKAGADDSWPMFLCHGRDPMGRRGPLFPHTLNPPT